MKKLASTLPNMILSLGTVAVVAGAVLGGVYAITKGPIEQQAAEAKLQAIREVAPAFDNNPDAEQWKTQIDGQEVIVYPAKMNGKLVGAAVKASSMNGFNGEVSVMAGFEADGTVKDYRVLQQAETPGLGTRMETWFRDPRGARSVIGKNPDTAPFYVVKDTDKHGTIDGITAATISSRAFLECMREAFEAYMCYSNPDRKPAVSVSDSASGASCHKEQKAVPKQEGKTDSHSGASEHKEHKEKAEKKKEKADSHSGATGHRENKFKKGRTPKLKEKEKEEDSHTGASDHSDHDN